MFPYFLIPFAESAHNAAVTIETDLPLFIQGFVMIALAAIPLFLSGRDRRKADVEENRHDEHMAELIVKAMKDEHAADTDNGEGDAK